jgi:hypothetical protein
MQCGLIDTYFESYFFFQFIIFLLKKILFNYYPLFLFCYDKNIILNKIKIYTVLKIQEEGL